MKIELDPFTKKRVLETMRDPDPKQLFLELAKEFGQRWGHAVAQGLSHAVAFEACKENFKTVGQAMIDVSQVVSLEMLGKTKEDTLERGNRSPKRKRGIMKFDKAEKFRETKGIFASHLGDQFGKFWIKMSPIALPLQVLVAPADEEWQHVSVSIPNRCPTWQEMCFIKDMFWGEDEVVLQYHPRKSEYVNNHPYCLHLWRPNHIQIPEPPSIFVGIK